MGDVYDASATAAIEVKWPPCPTCGHEYGEHEVDLEGPAPCEEPGCSCECYSGPDCRALITASVATALRAAAATAHEAGRREERERWEYAEARRMLDSARRRLLDSGDMLLEEGAIEEEEDYAENLAFCEAITRTVAQLGSLETPDCGEVAGG